MKTVWINKVRKREVKSGHKILSLEIPTMKPEVKYFKVFIYNNIQLRRNQ